MVAKDRIGEGGQLTHKNSLGSLTVPPELAAFSQPFCLLPGEDLHDLESVRQMMVDDIQPQTNIEWLWTLDLLELSWEILRYRRLKNRILDAHRVDAIEAILLRLDGEGMPTETMPMVRLQARRTAAEWRDDQEAAIEIEARLARNGFNNDDVNAELFAQARELFGMFDQLMQSAQNRRIGLLREISVHREFARRVRRVLQSTDSW